MTVHSAFSQSNVYDGRTLFYELIERVLTGDNNYKSLPVTQLSQVTNVYAIRPIQLIHLNLFHKVANHVVSMNGFTDFLKQSNH